MQLLKKTATLVLTFAMSSTLTLAEHTRTSREQERFNADIRALEQLPQININQCDVSKNLQVKLIDKALSEEAITSLSMEEFRVQFLAGLRKIQKVQERKARRVLSPSGLLEGRREARAERRLNRFTRTLSTRLGREVSREKVTQTLNEYASKSHQQRVQDQFAQDLNQFETPIEALQQARLETINAANANCQVLNKNENGISRSIAHAGMPNIPGFGAFFISLITALAGVSLTIAGAVIFASSGALMLFTLGIGLIVLTLILVTIGMVRSR